MAFKIVRQDITRMQVDAIVNTANEFPTVGLGCDYEIYKAAGWDELLSLRKQIGRIPEGQVFLTPGLHLPARYIIHAVSPIYMDGASGEEERLRDCYRRSLALAQKEHFTSIAFPLIATGSFGYPKEEGLRIAVDEIHAFLMHHEMMIYLVVFDHKAVSLSQNITESLEAYIDENYVEQMHRHQKMCAPMARPSMQQDASVSVRMPGMASNRMQSATKGNMPEMVREAAPEYEACAYEDSLDALNAALEDRMSHVADTFSQYLMYLIESKHMSYPEVYKRAIVDKKAFSKIKNNPQAHPKKMTAMCLCIGAKLNLDETRDLLARAGYALSPCDKTDIIFSYFIEHGIYDMIELDIQLEEHGLPCLIA